MTHITKKFTGSPLEIGAQVFNELCMPVVRSASNQLASPDQLVQLYAGFLSAYLGSMTADFGKEFTAAAAQTIIDSFQLVDLGPEASMQ